MGLAKVITYSPPPSYVIPTAIACRVYSSASDFPLSILANVCRSCIRTKFSSSSSSSSNCLQHSAAVKQCFFAFGCYWKCLLISETLSVCAELFNLSPWFIVVEKVSVCVFKMSGANLIFTAWFFSHWPIYVNISFPIWKRREAEEGTYEQFILPSINKFSIYVRQTWWDCRQWFVFASARQSLLGIRQPSYFRYAHRLRLVLDRRGFWSQRQRHSPRGI